MVHQPQVWQVWSSLAQVYISLLLFGQRKRFLRINNTLMWSAVGGILPRAPPSIIRWDNDVGILVSMSSTRWSPYSQLGEILCFCQSVYKLTDTRGSTTLTWSPSAQIPICNPSAWIVALAAWRTNCILIICPRAVLYFYCPRLLFIGRLLLYVSIRNVVPLRSSPNLMVTDHFKAKSSNFEER